MITAEEISREIALIQPHLDVRETNGKIVVSGKFILAPQQGMPDPSGAEVEVYILIVVEKDYPNTEPKVLDTRTLTQPLENWLDLHINYDESCCICIWEHWLVTESDHSFKSFLNGPVWHYFYGRYYYDAHNKWPYGEWAHDKGLEDAARDMISSSGSGLILGENTEDVLCALNLLSQKSQKGHFYCPCGSQKRLRDCHYDEIKKLRHKICPQVAKSLRDRIMNNVGQKVAKKSSR